MDESYKVLLQKFLAGACTDEEIRTVEMLISRPEIRQILDELMAEQAGDEWRNPSAMDESMKERVRLRQMEMMQRIVRPAAGDTGRHLFFKNNFLRYAAIWAGVFLVASVIVWQLSFAPKTATYAEIKNDQGVPVSYRLPDGSKVFLAAQSSLKYPEVFSDETREIHLHGEAFFEVTHDESKPFVIHTGNVQTRVLGTSFKVSAFDNESLEVAVATGKVRVSSHSQDHARELAVLTPGLRITWNRATGELQKTATDIHALQQWKSGELTFYQVPFAQVVQELQRRYNVQLHLTGKAEAYYPVSGTFSANESLTDILDMLGIVGKFRYETADGKTFVIHKL